MRALTLVAGVVCLFAVLLDAFQTIILPRRASGRFRLTRIFYVITWTPWVFLASGFAVRADARPSSVTTGPCLSFFFSRCGPARWSWALR
jgi:hypothetical protein